jgi:biofilm PGA synthesis N-glycosyltransferase PgaC
MSYVLMMPTLNERQTIRATLSSVVTQTVPPTQFIIIDGGSTDNTREIIKEFAGKYPWIQLIHQTNYQGEPGHKKISCAMVQAYQVMQDSGQSYDYVGHIDADFHLNPDVFKKLITELESDNTLGVAGGVLYTDGKPEIYPEDELPNMRLYRKTALDQIGGHPYSRYAWDTVILAKLRLNGWKIKAVPEAIVVNLRKGELSSKNAWSTAVSFGKARYYLGYSLPLFLAGTAYATKNNGIVFGVGLMAGFFGSLGKTTTKDEQILEYYGNDRLKEILGRDKV